MQLNVCAHHVKFRGVFLKLINIYVVTEWLVFIALQLLQGKSKKITTEEREKKTTETAFSKCSAKFTGKCLWRSLI